MISWIRFWAPVVIYMGILFWLSSRPSPGLLSEAPDYLLHGAAYFVLGILAVRALAKGLSGPFTFFEIAGGIVLAAVYGLSDEWHQSFVPGRDSSARDVLADSAGALAAGAGLLLLRRLRANGEEHVNEE
jgi:VanZ family protein